MQLIGFARAAALLVALTLLALFVWGGKQPEAAGLIPPPWDLFAHLAWFATLAGLQGFALGPRWILAVAVFALGIGAWDEWRQLTLPGRYAGWDDLLADAVGVALGLGMALWLHQRWLPR